MDFFGEGGGGGGAAMGATKSVTGNVEMVNSPVLIYTSGFLLFLFKNTTL